MRCKIQFGLARQVLAGMFWLLLIFQSNAQELSIKISKQDSSQRTAANRLRSKIDSLDLLHLPSQYYRQQLDSVNEVLHKATTNIAQQQAKFNVTVSDATKEISSKQSVLSGTLNTTSMTGVLQTEIPITLPSQANGLIEGIPKSPTLDLQFPNSEALDVQKELPGGGISNVLPVVPSKDIPAIPGSGVIDELKGGSVQLKQVSGQTASYAKDASGIIKGDSASLSKLSKKGEDEIKNAVEVGNLGMSESTLNEIKEIGDNARKQQLEKTGLETLKKQAKNHFAGKEQVLQNGMARLGKLKQKYSNITSMDNLPKRVPNEMHGKPFAERLVPGITWQVMKINSRSWRIDFNPSIGYRITGHFTAGGGWNEKLHYHNLAISAGTRLYGPRLYGEYKWKANFSIRVEWETMNTEIPPNLVALQKDPINRRWVSGYCVGFRKDYQIFKWMRGHAQIMYNMNSLFDRHHVNIYADPLIARFGFGFPIHRPIKSLPKLGDNIKLPKLKIPKAPKAPRIEAKP